MANKLTGKKIKALRDTKKVTLKAMGDHLGIGLTTYSAKEVRGDFTDADFGKILKKLGITREAFEAYIVPGEAAFELSIPETLITIEAKLDITLSAVAEILAKQTGQSVTGTANDLTKAVKERYEQKIAELLKLGQ